MPFLRHFSRRRLVLAVALLALAGLGAAGLLAFWGMKSPARAREEINKGREYLEAEDWPSAIQCFADAIRHDPDLTDAYLLHATAINFYLASYPKKEPRVDCTREDALRDIDHVLRLQPDSGEAYYQKGLAQAGLARNDEARAAFSQAIPLLDDPTPALFVRAAVAMQEGDSRAAVSDLTAVIARNPPDPGLYETRAQYRRFAGDPQGAREDLAEAARLRQNSNNDKADEAGKEGEGKGNTPEK